MNSHEPSRTHWLVYLVGVGGAFLIMGALVWAMYRYTLPAPVDAARIAERKKALADLRAADTDQLKNFGWLDQPKGIVRLPIATAMELTIREYQDAPAARSNLIARAAHAAAAPPKAPEQPSQYE